MKGVSANGGCLSVVFLRLTRSFKGWHWGCVWLGALALAVSGCASKPAGHDAANTWQRVTLQLVDSVLTQGLNERSPRGFRDALQPQPVVLKPSIAEPIRAEGAAGPELGRWVAQHIDSHHARYGRAETGSTEVAPAQRWELRVHLAPLDPSLMHGPGTYQMAVELYDPVRARVIASGREQFSDTSLDPLRGARAVAPAGPVHPRVAPAPVPSASERLQALNTEYLTLLRQGREAEAQVVFGRLIAASLAARNLGMKLLFASGSAQFWPDPVLAQRYDTWLMQLAQQLRETPHCLQLVGHASKTGTDSANRRLSLKRAEMVKQALLRHGPGLAPRLFTVGAGSEQPLAGSGNNDPGDAADRRVEFKVIDCP